MTVTLAEIQAKCTAALLASRDTIAIATQVSAGRTKTAPVQAATVRGAMYAMGVWSGIVARANAARANVDTSAVAMACQTLYDLATSNQTIPMDDPNVNARVTADINAMVAATPSLLTSAQASTVLGLATISNPVSEFEVRTACYAPNGGWLA